VEVGNALNKALVFVHQGGRVFVNGKPVCKTGTVVYSGRTPYVPEILVSQIRPYLKNGLAEKWTLPKPGAPVTPKAGAGLVVIDPGHGGKDPGATSYMGYYEKEVNLRIAQKTAALLRQRGIRVVMTRDSDVFVDLNDRADVANSIGADLFVSIHCDSNDSIVKRGYTVYIAHSASAGAKRAGATIEGALGQTGLSSKGVRGADYRVLVRTQCPAALVECGYMSNPNEATLLYDGQFQQRIANALADGIVGALSRL